MYMVLRGVWLRCTAEGLTTDTYMALRGVWLECVLRGILQTLT